MTLRLLVTLVCLHLMVAVADSAESGEGKVSLLDDTRFERGFTVWSSKAGSHVMEGTVQPRQSASEPIWGLAQWHSRFSLADAEAERMPNEANDE